MSADNLRWIETCDAEVDRRGVIEPCEKPAVAMVEGDAEFPRPWAVCAYHTRTRTAVPLTQIVAWAREAQP